jgi:hypothetical protein
MCTVSYLPQPNGGCIITSNRDETPDRNAIGLHSMERDQQRIVFPADPAAGGSWFAVASYGRIACLLNGAYQPFVPGPQYTHSRGQILLKAVASIDAHFEMSELLRTAPFTLVTADDKALHEYVWDGTELHIRDLDVAEPAFWSSVTLYPEDVRKWRKTMFDQWLLTDVVRSQEDIMRFHRYGGKEDQWNGFVMNRNERVRTLSITSAEKFGDRILVRHDNLISGDSITEELRIKTQDVVSD